MNGEQDPRLQDILRQEYTIETPENVTFGYDVAGIGSRAIGAVLDTLIVFALLGMLNLLLFFVLALVGGEELFLFGLEGDVNWVAGLMIALFSLLQFLVYWGYYLLFELVWNGQTPGKRVAHTRAVRLDGEPAGFAEVAVRNLVRIVDFLPFGYGVGVVTMLLNAQSRRLGDFAAGTLVVREHSSIKLADLAPARPRARIEPQSAVAEPEYDLRKLTHEDYTLLREAMAREAEGKLPFDSLVRLAAALAARVGAPAPGAQRVPTRTFLVELADAYDRRGREQR